MAIFGGRKTRLQIPNTRAVQVLMDAQGKLNSFPLIRRADETTSGCPLTTTRSLLDSRLLTVVWSNKRPSGAGYRTPDDNPIRFTDYGRRWLFALANIGHRLLGAILFDPTLVGGQWRRALVMQSTTKRTGNVSDKLKRRIGGWLSIDKIAIRDCN